MSVVGYVCEACADGLHDECIDVGDIDGYPMCSCDKGDCAPTLSMACAEWLHNCPGCPCSCHEDEGLRSAWSRVHRAWVEQTFAGNRSYGPKSCDSSTPGGDE